ncbi:MAG: hypothetical protein K0S44_2352 [Bacteroidetes bacterium]|jgi:membrane-associated phospholipid phosphatase|nr:hypothetical protein [Bacteroidota bacterium]
MVIAWKHFLSERKNKNASILSFLLLGVVLCIFLNFLSYNELQKGYVFYDPVLQLVSPLDLSIPTFLVTYSLCLSGIIISLKTPRLFIVMLTAYSILTVIRMCCLFFLPLEPPVGIIPLKDILLQFSFYSGRENLKDLFFSGHTATLLLFAFVFNTRKLKIIFSTGALIVGVLLMIQHVHYSIDVLAAPFAAWISVKIVKRFVFKNTDFIKFQSVR